MQAMIYVVIIAVVAGIGYWIIDAIPVQQPINRWAKILLVVIAAILLIGVLLNMAGVSIPR
jgi:predicted anti-sigma-YlaC factor YlaD